MLHRSNALNTRKFHRPGRRSQQLQGDRLLSICLRLAAIWAFPAARETGNDAYKVEIMTTSQLLHIVEGFELSLADEARFFFQFCHVRSILQSPDRDLFDIPRNPSNVPLAND